MKRNLEADIHVHTLTSSSLFLQAGSITAKELKECFAALDLDGDGLLSRKELALAVRALGTQKAV